MDGWILTRAYSLLSAVLVVCLSVSRMSQKQEQDICGIWMNSDETYWMSLVCDKDKLFIFWWRSESGHSNFKCFFTIKKFGQNRYIARYFKKLWAGYDKTWWMSWEGDKNKPIRFWRFVDIQLYSKILHQLQPAGWTCIQIPVEIYICWHGLCVDVAFVKISINCYWSFTFLDS